MLDFITRFFKREEASKTLAKERLRLVLMSDRVSLAPDIFDEMKGEMLAVIRRYLEIDERALDMHFENLERQFALLASIPVLKVRTAEEIRASHEAAATNGHALTYASSNGAAFGVHAGANAVLPAIDEQPTNGKTVRSSSSRRRRRRRRTVAPPDSAAPDETPKDEEPPTPPESNDRGPMM